MKNWVCHTQPAKNGIFEQRKIMDKHIGPVIVRHTKQLKDHGHNFETEDSHLIQTRIQTFKSSNLLSTT